MAVSVACPQCRASFTVGDDFLGRRIRCKSCGGPVPVGEVAAPERPRRRERRPDGSGTKTLLILLLVGGLLLGVVLVAGIIGVAVWRGGGRAPLGGPSLAGPEIEIGWPETPPLAGGSYGPNETVIFHISGVEGKDSYDAICEWLKKICDDPGRRAFVATASGDRMVGRLAPVNDPAAFARRVTFGKVILTAGRTVTIIANRNVAPPPKK